MPWYSRIMYVKFLVWLKTTHTHLYYGHECWSVILQSQPGWQLATALLSMEKKLPTQQNCVARVPQEMELLKTCKLGMYVVMEEMKHYHSFNYVHWLSNISRKRMEKWVQHPKRRMHTATYIWKMLSPKKWTWRSYKIAGTAKNNFVDSSIFGPITCGLTSHGFHWQLQ